MVISPKVDLNNFFGVDVQYQVPLYQRRYIWNEANWERLWRDILAQLDLELIEDAGGKFICKELKKPEDTLNLTPDQENVRRHFTGIIVTRPIHEEALERFEVIDGQQRLTTFQIILCVIRDIFQSANYDDQAADANALIANKPAVAKRYSDATYKFIPTEYDKDEFEVVAKGKYGEPIPDAFDKESDRLDPNKLREIMSDVFSNSDDLSVNVLNAYNDFYEWIRIYMEKDFDYKKLDDLLYIIKTQFTFAIISLERGDKSEEIFESLNATGQMLSEFDYLRNNLFLRARKLGGDSSGKLFRDIFYNDPNYWPFEENWDTQKLEAFLKAYLMATWNPECFKAENAKPFEEYRKYSKFLEKTHSSNKDRIQYEFTELSKWAESYQNLQIKQVFKDYKNFCDDLSFRDLDSFLLFIEHTNSGQLIDATKILESYIIRSLLVLEDETRSHADIKESCFETIESCFSRAVGTTFCKNSFVNCLLSSNPEIDLGNSAVGDAFWETSVYKNKNAAFINYVLNRIIQRDPVMPLGDFNWEMHQRLITDITERLSSTQYRPELIDNFNKVWPELI